MVQEVLPDKEERGQRQVFLELAHRMLAVVGLQEEMVELNQLVERTVGLA
jgi:hypothetical protein